MRDNASKRVISCLLLDAGVTQYHHVAAEMVFHIEMEVHIEDGIARFRGSITARELIAVVLVVAVVEVAEVFGTVFC